VGEGVAGEDVDRDLRQRDQQRVERSQRQERERRQQLAVVGEPVGLGREVQDATRVGDQVAEDPAERVTKALEQLLHVEGAGTTVGLGDDDLDGQQEPGDTRHAGQRAGTPLATEHQRQPERRHGQRDVLLAQQRDRHRDREPAPLPP
jgi:hypothetical protein